MSSQFCTDPSMHLLNCTEQSTIHLLMDLEKDSSRESLLRVRRKVFKAFQNLNISYRTTNGLAAKDSKRIKILLDKHKLELSRLMSVNNMLNQKFTELQTSPPAPSFYHKIQSCILRFFPRSETHLQTIIEMKEL